MRALFSYGVAFLIILVGAVWLGTGYFIQGGQGPGKGERPMVSLIEPKGGVLTDTVENGKLQAPLEHVEGAPDPELTIAQRQAETTGSNAPARSVRVKTFTAQPMAIEVPLRGQTKAKASVTAVAETSGIIAEVLVSKGQTVKVGDLLCKLDQGTRQASVTQAEAAIAQSTSSITQTQADLDTNASLRERGLANANSGRVLEVALAAAKSNLTAGQAALDQAKQELARTEIRAKVAGVVQDPLADVGAMLAAGAPCATVVQLDPLVFTGNVPESRIALAHTGLEAKITTVTGQESSGKVSFISSVADAATRSFPIEIDIPNANGAIKAGMTATAIVNLGTAPAQLLPQSVLTLDDDGTLGVRAVENGKVAFYPVTIVNDTREGVWITGLPAKLDVITVGQEFVQAGQTVNASQADGA
jgi:multidrug efflux system membrane fusion protein